MSEGYASVTEVPGGRTTREGLSRAYSRYRFAAGFCDGRDVLELACGAGFGLGYLGHRARRVVGGDYTREVLDAAAAHYRGSIPLLQLDAHHLPFAPASFDVVVVQEALYYFHDAETVFREIRRVLRHPGTLVVTSVNAGRPDFHPSPFSTKYLGAGELAGGLSAAGFAPELFGGFDRSRSGFRSRVVSALKRLAVQLDMIPRSLEGRAPLKRLFLGPLRPVPAELSDGMAPYDQPVPIAPADHSRFTILYVAARTR